MRKVSYKKILLFLVIILLPLIIFNCDEAKRMIFDVNIEKCNGCGICVDVCPENAIEIIDGKAYIDVNSCTGCSKCVVACPQDAIR